MSKQIDWLTPEQEARIPAVRDEWSAVGLNTDRIDEAESRDAILRLYKVAGQSKPKDVIFFPSVLAAATEAKKQGYEDTNNLYFLGGWDAYWLAYYHFGRELGADYGKQLNEWLDAYTGFAKSSGVAYMYEDKVFVSDRPSQLHFDADKKLHNPRGAALEYVDGFGIWMIHGERVQRVGVEDDKVSVRWEQAEEILARAASNEFGDLSDPNLTTKIIIPGIAHKLTPEHINTMAALNAVYQVGSDGGNYEASLDGRGDANPWGIYMPKKFPK